VAFRLDDVQDYFLSPIQRSIIEVFQQQKTPLTIGIIANYFGLDATLLEYMKSILNDNQWDLEIANHGFNHEDFSSFTLDQQKSLLLQGVNKTLQTLSGYIKKITTFVPPFNYFNNDTIAALLQTGFDTMSSELYYDPSPYPTNVGASLYRWPIGASTSNQASETISVFLGIPHNETMAQIKAQLATYGFAAVMVHPQEFALLDSENHTSSNMSVAQIQQLQLLLEDVKNAGITFTTLGGIKDIFISQSNVHSASQATSGMATTGSKATTGSIMKVTTGHVGTTGNECLQGKLGCSCFTNGTCGENLVCQSEACVYPEIHNAASFLTFNSFVLISLLGIVMFF